MRRSTIDAVIKHTCIQCGCPEMAARGRIRLEFSNRFSGWLADAEYDPTTKVGSVRISTHFWKRLTAAQKIELIIHEVCHVIADYSFEADRPHGREWKLLMRCAGIKNPEACIEI